MKIFVLAGAGWLDSFPVFANTVRGSGFTDRFQPVGGN